jgi:hypothetical protein
MWEISSQQTVNSWVRHLKCRTIDLPNTSSTKWMLKVFVHENVPGIGMEMGIEIEIGIGMRNSPPIS